MGKYHRSSFSPRGGGGQFCMGILEYPLHNDEKVLLHLRFSWRCAWGTAVFWLLLPCWQRLGALNGSGATHLLDSLLANSYLMVSMKILSSIEETRQLSSFFRWNTTWGKRPLSLSEIGLLKNLDGESWFWLLPSFFFYLGIGHGIK